LGEVLSGSKKVVGNVDERKRFRFPRLYPIKFDQNLLRKYQIERACYQIASFLR
jgi:hypothetical protein